MAKEKSRTAAYLVYLIVRLIVCFLQALSFEQACAFAKGLAWLAYHVDKRHRLVALDNLRIAFPGRYSEAELDRMVRAVYRHFCTLLVELVHAPRRLHATNWRRYLDLDSALPIIDRLLSDRPIMIVTGHFGNWEMAGYALGLFGFRTHAIARELDNPYLDRYLKRFRESTGQTILDKNKDYARMREVLDQAGVLATLADQDAGQRGLFVDFFGRPASTHKAVALFSLEHRVPLVVTGTPRIGGRYRVAVGDIIDPADYDDQPDAVRAITQRFTTALEGLIRTAPEQYFWLHRRWKHQPPPPRKGKKAA